MKLKLSLAFLLAALVSLLMLVWSQVTSLPLGDGKVLDQPQVGYVFACPTHPGPPLGAHHEGEWIQGKVWYPSRKVFVDGEVLWKNANIEIRLENNQRVIRANNLPTHPTGVFPISFTDDAYQYDRNPNAIREQTILLTLPALPTEAGEPSCLPMGMIGFALTGVAIYNALDAQQRDAPAYEIQDTCKGHPEVSGQYHYHDWSDCIQDKAGRSGKHSDLIGYALDGFGIYGLHGEDGQELSNTDLDACHGHTHALTWDDGLLELYHYHMTREYPYTLGCFQGEVNLENRSPSGAPPLNPTNP
jgi:YHYH protein